MNRSAKQFELPGVDEIPMQHYAFLVDNVWVPNWSSTALSS